MSEYTVIPDLAQAAEAPSDGILSRTLYQDGHIKVVLFAFAAGQELSEHTASTAALLHVVSGRARLTLGGDTVEAGPGAWIHMPPLLKHAIRTEEPTILQLVLLKQATA